MKKIIVIITCMLINLFAAQAQKLTIGTFNLRYDNPADTGNLWKDRVPVAAALIRFHGFDIVGTQEGLRNQLDDLQRDLTEYSFYGIGRDDGRASGEHSAIFYKKEKYDLQESGDFWLSETPEKPGFGWDARNNRICSWVKLRDRKTKKSFYVFNVHYDHRGVQARVESSKLIVRKITEIAKGEAVILTGDFNGNHQSEWYQYIQNGTLLKDALWQVEHPYRNNGSFNSFKTGNPSKDIIDHIFLSKHFTATRYGVLTDTYHGKFPSDHYPVLAGAELK